MVHGFMGWGPDEMAGYNYWGGKHDIKQHLIDQGYDVYLASVGPVSSNWDRAVELYYQIKGGQVDYGKFHSEKYGIIQKPPAKNYLGLYPKWDADHPVHIIGHSMGGQTARLLQYLLVNVISSDSIGMVPEESELLGHSKTGWIHSITTLSTPHDGSTLSDLVSKTLPFLQDFIGLTAVVGTNFFDFDLQQWGFRKVTDETWASYFRRMRKHPAWGTHNICAWDVSLAGAQELNTLATADPAVYYFSFTTYNTNLDTASGYHVPAAQSMRLILRANAKVMGRIPAYWPDGKSTDSTWYQNDGIVNTVSQIAPTSGLNGPDPIADYRPGELLIPGQWYHIRSVNLDHKMLLGHGLNDKQMNTIFALFSDHCELLQSLPE